jgi:hypothetical protein
MDNNEGNSEEADFYGGVEHRNGGTDDNGNARRPVKNFEDLMEAMDEDTAVRRKDAARNDNLMDRVTVHIKEKGCIYANSKDLCVCAILSLARYLHAKPRDETGPLSIFSRAVPPRSHRRR